MDQVSRLPIDDGALPGQAGREVTAQRLLAGFAAKGSVEKAIAASEAGERLLRALGGHSPYLADLALRESQMLARMLERGPDAAFATVLAPLARIDPGSTRAAVMTRLREAKRQGALIAAAADLAGLWPLDKVTQSLSTLAESAIDTACAVLLREAAARGELRLPKRAAKDAKLLAKGSGLVILGMGKLGAGELNYSSDIDLMVLYDPSAAATEPDTAGPTYVRLARDLVRMLEERTSDGYVFRTDLRLRPDPAATPLAVSIPAAIAYYESLGQNWERAALTKARPVGGDRAAGEAFLREIRPFIWRRHLDFAMIADIHSIKRQIHAHKGARGAGAAIAVAGHDVKLGRGGIREIEFHAQVLQLIWGGRDPALRDPTTLGALAGLAGAGKMDRRAAAALADAYVFLRHVEHRLQMVDDRQTHRLPEDPVQLANIAGFMGYRSIAAFSDALLGHLAKVERHYARLFEEAPSLSAPGQPQSQSSSQPSSQQAAALARLVPPAGDLVFTGVEDDPGTLATLSRMGYRNPASVAAMVRGWHHGRVRAMRSERARELLTALMPMLLAAFARQREPDVAFARFDNMLGRLSAGVQILSLFDRNPALMERVAGLLGAGPALAEHLARNPAALDGLLAGSVLDGAGASALPALVKEARHVEEAMHAAARLANEAKFEIDAAALEATLDPDTAGRLRAEVADAAITALLPRVAADFAERHGRIAGGALAIVAMGKLGGREMLPGSDLDLILIYDHSPDAGDSKGGTRSLAPSQYFARLAQQMIAAITSPGPEGRLYEVDMRLRPSGSKGPVATSLTAFRAYHETQAWTWERMALTRARVIAGPPALRKAIQKVIQEALIAHAGPKALEDARAMRLRMLRDLPADGPWDVKAMPGGLVEVEFIAQALQLAHAAENPAILTQTTREALAALAKAGILSAEESQALINADRLWRAVQSTIRLTLGRWREEALPESSALALLRSALPFLTPPPVDLPAFRTQMRQVAATVRQSFERHIGPLDRPGETG
ncbi:bifunctional [glutamine synthetase] adenylyltransferase/[glutamine synthetase]-adenylyl-L-tyrosine phosphorylase [Acetobacteraceae bacterium H6797]|nr:bifunctional [glutamine synthetase] adenylyltransferase/[glutamine synthetase]-adenylyl-L-tyrosine phosphorylase [Acetobacteraceae bacterium H6797]